MFNNSSRNTFIAYTILLILVVLLLGLGIGVYSHYYKQTVTEATLYIEDKERLVEVVGDKDGTRSINKFIVYTENEVFKVEDTIAVMFFSTYDVYNKLKKHHKCNVTVGGWRVPLLSMTRNIIAVKSCVKEGV